MGGEIIVLLVACYLDHITLFVIKIAKVKLRAKRVKKHTITKEEQFKDAA